MLKLALYFTSILSIVLANGQFSVLHNPKSIEFEASDGLGSDEVAEVLSAALGYSVAQPSGFGGFYINDPFNMPKGVVAVVLDGINKINLQQGKNPSYTLTGSSATNSINNLASVVEQNGKVLDLNLYAGYDSLTPYTNQFGNVKPVQNEKITSSLKPQLHPEDKLFLQQLDILELVADKLESLDEKPNLIIVRISMSNLLSAHTIGSPAIPEAMKLLSAGIQKLSESAEQAYKNDVLVTVVATKDELKRSKRQVGPVPDNINLAKFYDEDYPVIFNIILWFGVAFTFSLMAICMAIATMDPGRDSIIYRMTLNRLKKEN